MAHTRIESAEESRDDPSIELAFWETVRESDKPDMLQAYLVKYPNGQFRDLANIMIANLGRAKPAPSLD